MTDAGQKLNIMVTTGEKLPDIVVMGLDVATAYAYGDAGAFLNLRDYYDRGLAVNVDKAVAAFPDWNLLSNITNHDGSVYAIPKIQVSLSNETKYKMWINKTWLGWTCPPPRMSSMTCWWPSATGMPTAAAILQ